MIFEWDSRKNVENILKHGISFEIAQHVFEDESALIVKDLAYQIEEDRYRIIGVVNGVLVVAFTERRENIRLISARVATKRERRAYYAGDARYFERDPAAD